MEKRVADRWPGHPLGRRFLRGLLRLLIKLLFRVRVTGAGSVPAAGPVIVIINHIALLDPVLVTGIFPRTAYPLAKREVFDWFLVRTLLNLAGVIPVNRGEVDVRAIKAALRVLKEGGVVLLAPEGTRSPTYRLQPAKEGVSLLALHSGAVIVPVGIVGAHRTKAHWLRLQRAPIDVSIGPPFRLQALGPTGRASREEMATMTREAMYRLAAQLPAGYRGVYDNPAEATADYLEVEA